MPVVESLFTIPESAKLARISPRMFWKLISSHRAPEVIRIGRAVRVRASDMNLWLRLGCPSREALESAKQAAEGTR